MKKIPLSQGQFALVDDEDFERVNQFKWCATKGRHTFYAIRNVYLGETKKKTTISMHSFIVNASKTKTLIIDHKDRNGLNNQKSNLRLCTYTQNRCNSFPRKNSSSIYKGVKWCKDDNKFQARIMLHGKRLSLGYFTDEIEAAKAYDEKAKELHGEFAYLNFPEEKINL